MRVVHIVHGKANPHGHNGISRVVYHLNKEEKLLGLESEIWAVIDGAKKHYSHVRDPFVTIECFPRVRIPFGHQPIIEHLIAQRKKIDLVHFHMIWLYDKNIIAKALKRAGVPFIITAHGTYLSPHANKGRRKLARLIYECDYLNSADEIHAITSDEAIKLADYGYHGKTFLAPNGVALDEIPARPRSDANPSLDGTQKARFIWIGVKRRDKNLPSLIRGVALLSNSIRSEFLISLIGPDYKGNERRYRALASKLGVEANFEFQGPLYGRDKYDALERAEVFILPSFSEVYSLAMLDAMACGRPCLASVTCGYGPYSKDNFFVPFEPTPEGIASGITEMLRRRHEWSTMGRNARAVIERDLNWPAIARTMVKNYARIIAQ